MAHTIKVSVALGAKAKKQMYLSLNLQPFEDMAKKGFGTIAFVIGIFLTRSWFRNLYNLIIPVGSGKPEFTTSLFDTNNRTI
jgi:hypothetical protein